MSELQKLFFGGDGGEVKHMEICNKNTTFKQFSAAFKKLLVHIDKLDITSGNCLAL